jgi:hypothetical protein
VKKEKLFILSIPFQRIVRSHLSPELIDTLTQRGDLLIISPFAHNNFLQNQYKKNGIQVIAPPSIGDLPNYIYKLWNISELLRRQGFYHTNQDTPYNWSTRYKVFGDNGNDKELNFFKKIIINIFGFLGSFPCVWRIFDTLHGYISYSFNYLHICTKSYEKIIYVSACCWGFQDAMLGFWSRKKKWKSILIPYSTDQLYSNGWLFCDFDAICVQGEAEYRFARKFHKLDEKKIVKLGSSAAFNMRRIICSKKFVKATTSKNFIRVLFAGSDPLFFPIESEYKALEFILSIEKTFITQDLFITYRPLTQNGLDRQIINDRFCHYPNLKIEYASPTTFGLTQFEECKFEDIVTNHVSQLINYDIMIMIGLTSLAIDMAVLNTPSIAFFEDPSGVLQRRETFKNFNEFGEFIGFECYPIAHSKADLADIFISIIQNSHQRTKIVNDIITSWDYNKSDYLNIIDNLISDI